MEELLRGFYLEAEGSNLKGLVIKSKATFPVSDGTDLLLDTAAFPNGLYRFGKIYLCAAAAAVRLKEAHNPAFPILRRLNRLKQNSAPQSEKAMRGWLGWCLTSGGLLLQSVTP
jgi:hypothetical protein